MLNRNIALSTFITAATLLVISACAAPNNKIVSTAALYSPPSSPRTTFNFDPDWKFIREDVPSAETPAFDDSAWTTVSTPHSFNDVDSFRMIISHSGGDRGTYKGLSWYRKHFKLPADLSDKKIFLEFEGMRQAGDIFLNGKEVGLYENGVTGYGIDITNSVKFGGDENILAVKVDNRTNYQERETKTGFEWNANDFNPDHGGINRHVWLHVTGKIYQTLPLYYGLETTGSYIYGQNYNIPAKTADITAESQVQNSSDAPATLQLTANIVDHNGQLHTSFSGKPTSLPAGQKAILTATGPLADARFWSVEGPYLYDVYLNLSIDGKIIDSKKITTGFRKTEFKGGAGTGGVYINDQFVYLKGFSQRASDEWAGLSQAYPDWMHDLNAKMIRDCNGNYMRWMHISPQKVDADAFDRYGIIQVCPAGDKERLVEGRQWDQRVEVMRDSMIYFRNNPSILFWEAGNTIVTPAEMVQMVNLRKELDPFGGRVMGTRDNDQAEANSALTPVSEFYGVMIGQDRRTDDLKNPKDIFRGYSIERRDKAPLIETEDFRDEGARRFWDDFSPPYFGFKKGPNDTYQYTSETFALAQVRRYWDYWTNCISNTDPAHSKWSGYSSIYFFDSDADGRQDSSEVARVSGKVDAVRLPKEIYFAERVMQNTHPDLFILGHWSYPTDKKITKPINIIANTQSVELFVNGKSVGKNNTPNSGYIFNFPNIDFAPGSIRAVGYNDDKQVAEQEIKTAGPAAAVKLTPILGPNGLQADGGDVALFDVEVVDAEGQRCPTDDDRIDFTLTGPATWRGGYNSGKTDSTNNLYLNTECGINRVAIRASRTPGAITLTASRNGLKSATTQIEAKPVTVTAGLATFFPQHLQAPAEK